MKYQTTVEGKTFLIEVAESGEVLVDGETYTPDFRSIDGLSLYSLLMGNTPYELLVEEEPGHIHVLVHGEPFAVQVRETLDIGVAPPEQAAPPSGPLTLLSPIPGVVIELLVEAGDTTATGQVLLVLESMKMENEFRSPGNGVIREIRVNREDEVTLGQPLLILDIQ